MSFTEQGEKYKGERAISDIRGRLKSLKTFQAIFPLLVGRMPGQLVIQYTDRCNARCPQCGMRITESFRRSRLDSDVVKRIIDSARKKGMQAVSFTGGEPFLYFYEIVELIQYAGDAGIRYTRTGTNGFLFMNSHKPDYEAKITRIAEILAATGLYNFWISMDSADAAVHEEMRGLPGVVAGIKKALPIFHKHGIYPSANLGINRNTGGFPLPDVSNSLRFYKSMREAFRKFYMTTIDLGFTMVNACYPMSLEPGSTDGLHAVYGASSEAPLIQFSPDEKSLVFKALFDTIPEFRSKIRIFSPRSSLYSLLRQYTVGEEYCYPCRGGIDFFFVDAKGGNTYPCGYRGDENLGKFWGPVLRNGNEGASCKKCDWECFRDPSELFGPLQSLFSRPVAFFERVLKDRAYIGLWLEDLRYSSACGFFNGRSAPDYKALSAFRQSGTVEEDGHRNEASIPCAY